MAFALHSLAFDNNGVIPNRHARDGENLSPPLAWSGAPEGTKSFVLAVEDPDAPSGSFWHWALLDIGPDEIGLPEGAGSGGEGARHAVNDFGKARYDGPQPPRGHGVHHYHFRLAALDVARLELPKGATAKAAWAKARKHAIAETELIGTFER